MLGIPRFAAIFAGIGCLFASAQLAGRSGADATTPIAKASDLTVTIAVSESTDPRSVGLNVEDPRLQVVVRNTASHSIKLWNEGNSCGYDNLTLEIYSVDGVTMQQPIVVGRHIDSWFSNMISSFVLEPGDCIVRDVRFARTPPRTLGEHWFYEGFPVNFGRELGRPHTLGMRAVFTTKPNGYTAAHSPGAGVWTGTASSEPHDYRIDTYSAPTELPH